MYVRKTKIVCTIGPATESPEMLRNLITSGMNVARLNFSHGAYQDHQAKTETIKSLRTELTAPVALLADTKGPEIRIKTFKESPVQMVAGETFTLTTNDVEGTDKMVSVTYADLPEVLKAGDKVLLDDGLIGLVVESISGPDIVCRVQNNGPLSNRKSVNLPGIKTNMPYMDEKDRADIKFAYENDFDYIALSFVREAKDVVLVKNFLESLGPSRCELIAKIENAEGVNNIDAIIAESDGIMVARGDLGVEIPFEELPAIQKMLIDKCYEAGKKVITATQMLESMTKNPRPTRAEVTDIANAIYDGTSATMLSGETAAGKYPIESLKTMIKIAEQTEKSIDYKRQFYERDDTNISKNITNAISYATCSTAHDLGAAAIVAVTRNGSAGRMISRFRPQTPIVVSTPSEKTYYQMALTWGVTPLLSEVMDSPDALFKAAAAQTAKAGIAKDGDLIVITGSSSFHSNITNTVQVHVLGNVLATGKGEGGPRVSSRACVISRRGQPGSFSNGDILVIDKTTTDILRLIKRAKGVVTEEAAEDSGAVAAAIALDIPVIDSVENATRLITDGSGITLDPVRGYILNSGASDLSSED
ncbi:MAG: pyruvate kinase [Oscillospiraceae bacterium]|nr:pyruvate kinase [Oscillospiraceae bacterium]